MTFQKTRVLLIVLCAGVALAALPAKAQEVYFYPSKGQSAAQLEKDKTECYSWGKQQTGFDPMTPAPTMDTTAAAAANDAKQGSAVRGGARGAARGAAVGAVAGDAGKGAAVGAAAGGARGRAGANRSAQNAQAQANADYEARLAAYNAERAKWQRAASSCMDGRGYSVK